MDGVADYTFVRALGEGGYGRFFLALPPSRLHVEADYVAVKVMPGANDPSGLRRATRELRAFAATPTPYLVRLLDAGRAGDLFFYATEFYAGGSLAEPTRPLTRQETRTAVAQAARGAQALHQAGIVHRSIKPANVLLHEDGTGRLGDLGLAQAFQPMQTMTGLGAMTAVEFVEPHLLSGDTPSPASDIWSLAVTLHRSLTGEGIYGTLPRADPLLCVRTVLTKRPVLSPALTPGESQLIGRCLDVAGHRPDTAEIFADELESIS